ncbi:lysozyme-like domain-containing protein [Chytriomyces cf. hyalinus JEL632]|nr:lysozyme-like domain-containing protein [Chytriomyces cf. hyalinus JEL632]
MSLLSAAVSALLLASASTSVSASPQFVQLRQGTQDGAVCTQFGEWGCDSQSLLLQCAYQANAKLAWVKIGGPCSILNGGNDLPNIPVPPKSTANPATSTGLPIPAPQPEVPAPAPQPEVPVPAPQPEVPIPAPQPGKSQSSSKRIATSSFTRTKVSRTKASKTSTYGASTSKPSPAGQTKSSSAATTTSDSTVSTGVPITSTYSSSATTTSIQGTYPKPGGSGPVSSLINEATFNKAVSACGINKPNLYQALVQGFQAPLPGGLPELALLLGNTAHESGAFKYTEEIACAGVSQVTGSCPYGLFHGRGYIQLSWDYNYKAAATALNRPDIFTNPRIVQEDEATNWSTVQWYWTASVQPALKSNGYTLAASVRAINGGLECGGNPIAAQRVQFVQCFQRELAGTADYLTSC